jgi:hypothetical protein
MGGTPQSAHLAIGFKEKKKKNKKTGSLWADSCPGKARLLGKISEGACRQRANKLLLVGWAYPLQSPPRGIKLQALHLSGNTVMVKGMETFCPILNATFQPLPTPGDPSAHIASWTTPQGGHKRPTTQVRCTPLDKQEFPSPPFRADAHIFSSPTLETYWFQRTGNSAFRGQKFQPREPEQANTLGPPQLLPPMARDLWTSGTSWWDLCSRRTSGTRTWPEALW